MDQFGTVRHIMLPVQDMTAALSLYADVLGLALEFRDGDRWAVLSSDHVRIALAGPSEHPAYPHAAVACKVGDVESAVAALTARGGTVLEDITESEHERRAAVRADDGQVLVIYSPRGR